ncbi:unnamed protein product [Effrenium voratum]|nr:unnamed protein product [Effrenium voratum]
MMPSTNTPLSSKNTKQTVARFRLNVHCGLERMSSSVEDTDQTRKRSASHCDFTSFLFPHFPATLSSSATKPLDQWPMPADSALQYARCAGSSRSFKWCGASC